MKIVTGCFLWLVLGCSALPAFASVLDDENARPSVEIEYTVKLSTPMQAALNKFDPNFKPWPASKFTHVMRVMSEYKAFRLDRDFLSYQTPSVIIADFNGDNLPDAAMLGHNKTHYINLVLMSSPKGYRVVPFEGDSFSKDSAGSTDIAIDNYKIDQALEYVEPKKIKAKPGYNRPELDLKNDAFIYGGETGSTIYVFKDNKFVNYAMSD